MNCNRTKIGPCSVCGLVRKLSYEHVPPESAFNDSEVLVSDIRKVIGSDLLEELQNPSGRINQRGAGGYTLCEKCNNITGSWYGAAYVNFVKAVYPIANRVRPGELAYFSVRCKPQNVLKQIITMFCSACGPNFAIKKPEVVRYILNCEICPLPQDISVFLAFFDRHSSRATRQSGITGRLSLDAGSHIYSEISFPPFNIVMTLNSPAPHPRLFEITWFKEFNYGESAWVNLRLWNLAVNSFFPGDYRTYDELTANSTKSSE